MNKHWKCSWRDTNSQNSSPNYGIKNHGSISLLVSSSQIYHSWLFNSRIMKSLIKLIKILTDNVQELLFVSTVELNFQLLKFGLKNSLKRLATRVESTSCMSVVSLKLVSEIKRQVTANHTTVFNVVVVGCDFLWGLLRFYIVNSKWTSTLYFFNKIY